MTLIKVANLPICFTHLLVLNLLVAGSALAQSKSTNDEEALLLLYGDTDMISIATGSRQPLDKAPAVATVVTAEDIRAIGATDLDEVLETVPGLHVARSSTGYNPIYTIRGVYSGLNPQVLMMINGIPLANLYTGNRSSVWGGMPVEAIERVEVIRGPGSAVYGADAFAGVINIITKTSEDIPGSEIGARAGSFDTRDAWVLHGDSWGDFDVALALEYHETDGQSGTIGADGQTALDAALGTTASLAPGPVSLQRKNIDARFDVSRGDWRFRAGLQRRKDWGNGAGIAQNLDPVNRFSSDRWNLDLIYHNPDVTENLDVRAELSFLDASMEVARNTVLFPPGAVLPIGSDGNVDPVSPAGLVTFTDGYIGNPSVYERHYRAGASTFYSGLRRHLLRAGAGVNVSDVYKVKATQNFGPGVIDGTVSPIDGTLTDRSDTPYTFLPEDDRKNYYVFLQDVWSIANDWELTAGVRYDYYSDFDSTVNPRLALVWSLRHDMTTKLLYGRAFRAPSFAESRVTNNPAAIGNPDLDPETISTFELAFAYRYTDTLEFDWSVFHYEWDDIIEFVPDSAGSTAQNAGKQKGYGLELGVEWRPVRSLRLLGNYAGQRSRDESANQNAGYAPEHQVYLRAEWAFLPDWQLTPQVNRVMSRPRAPGDNRNDIDDYTLVDLTLRRKNIKDHWGLALIARNLFDEDAREPSLSGVPESLLPGDLPLAGRSFLGELRYDF